MPSKTELEKRYADYSNEQLLDLLNERESYTELAVGVASEEVKRRHLSEQDIKDYVAAKYRKAELYIEKNIHDELSLFLKSLFYFCWVPVLTFPFKLNFQEDGAILKLKQLNFYSFSGFVFCSIGAVCIWLFKFQLLSAIGIWVAGMLCAMLVDTRFNRDRIVRRFEKIIKSHNDILKQRSTDQDSSQLP